MEKELMHIILKERIFSSQQEWFHDCHANTQLKIGEDEYLVAFWAGTSEGTPDQAIWLSRFKEGKWHPPVRIKYIYQLPHWNPVLFQHGGKIYLFYKVGLTVQTWYTYVSWSEDGGYTWTEAKEAVPGDYRPRATVRNKILLASNGAWIAPTSRELGEEMDCYADISYDAGETWEMASIPIAHQKPESLNRDMLWEGLRQGALWENDLNTVGAWDGVIQPTMWESEKGKIHALMRSTRGRIYRSDSTDYGKTWCEAYPTQLPNNCCGIDAVRMENGTLAVVYNPIPYNWGKRSPLSVSLSEDNGKTFSEPFHLEMEPGEYSYPSVTAQGNMLNIFYTENRRTFVHCIVSV